MSSLRSSLKATTFSFSRATLARWRNASFPYLIMSSGIKTESLVKNCLKSVNIARIGGFSGRAVAVLERHCSHSRLYPSKLAFPGPKIAVWVGSLGTEHRGVGSLDGGGTGGAELNGTFTIKFVGVMPSNTPQNLSTC